MSKLKQLIKDVDSTRTEYLNKKEILNRLLEIDKINNIEVIEPTELRKEFENEIKAGDTVVVLGEGHRAGTVCIAMEVDRYNILVRVKGRNNLFWKAKSELKKI